MNDFELIGEERSSSGTGDARRLRREGKVPAILYGGESEPLRFALERGDVRRHLENEAFLSHILSVKVGGQESQAVLKAVQRDPVSSEVTHMDLLRISETREIQINVPLHFMNEESCNGVKMGGIISHLVLEVEVRCLPRYLPEFLEVDMGPLDIGETVHLSEVKLPEGVELSALRHGDDQALVSIQLPRAVEEEISDADGESEESEFDEDLTKLVQAGGDDNQVAES